MREIVGYDVSVLVLNRHNGKQARIVAVDDYGTRKLETTSELDGVVYPFWTSEALQENWKLVG